MDINSPHTVDRYVPEITKAELVRQDCQDYLYCGLPYLVPVLTMIWKTHWVPGSSPELQIPIRLKVLSREAMKERERITVQIEGRVLYMVFQKCRIMWEKFLFSFAR